ncbi:MAG: ATP-binding protein [Pseudomonadota bacterium]
MDDKNLDALLARLEKQPHNLTLRLAVMRRAMGAAMASRALELALELDPDGVPGTDDRALVAEVYRAAGMDEDAALWDASPTTQAPPPPPDPTGERVLRVVGGRESDTAAPPPTEDPPALSFDDIGGLDEVKRDIRRRIIAPFAQAGLLSRFKKRAGGGVLLFGPPGCGKTLIARATAGEVGCPFISVSISDILDPLSGMSERHLTAVFDKARHQAPAILFFDEIDALGSKRTSASATHNAQLVSHFLSEMDGTGARNEGVLVLAATNVPWSIDGAFLRPGRFDRLFFVPPPDREARAAILALELGTRPAAAGLRLDRIAAETSGLSGADLALIVETAADMAIDATLEAGEEVPIDERMLTQATRGALSSVTEWLTTARNYATYANESGRYDDVMAFLKAHGRG